MEAGDNGDEVKQADEDASLALGDEVIREVDTQLARLKKLVRGLCSTPPLCIQPLRSRLTTHPH